jgi:hypothetical protein
MMAQPTDEMLKLAEEVKPYMAFDPERWSYLRDDAPEDIKEKYKRLKQILKKAIPDPDF